MKKISLLAYTPRLGNALKTLIDNPRQTDLTARESGGTARRVTVISESSESPALFGSFLATRTGDEIPSADISSGWLLRNGQFIEIAETKSFPLAIGYLCLTSEIDEDANVWKTPEFKILESPSNYAYPVAKIEGNMETGDISIYQYPVTVAHIMAVRQCPLAQTAAG